MATSAEPQPTAAKQAKDTPGYKDRPWIPRFWDGMTARAWLSALGRNRFAIHPARIPMAIIITLVSLVNSALAVLQEVRHGRRIRTTELPEDPVFIVGHWRSGTTMLHELLVLDPRHTYPDTYECFAPAHFLVSGWILPRMLKFLMPNRRPMDNVAAGWDRPQEDEFALCNSGMPSPYLSILFPNHPPAYPEYLDLEGLSDEALGQWKAGMLHFLRCLTVRTAKRIILKSPPHTARIKTLLALFPRARFVHIVRDPYVVFASTVNLWKRLNTDQGLQIPHHRGLEEYVFANLVRMYAAFERDRPSIPAGQFSEVRYEELVGDVVGQMERVYRELELGGFESVRPALEAYAARQPEFKTNRYPMPEELRAEVAQRWSAFCQRYGY